MLDGALLNGWSAVTAPAGWADSTTARLDATTSVAAVNAAGGRMRLGALDIGFLSSSTCNSKGSL
jgi:hypothetical protein